MRVHVALLDGCAGVRVFWLVAFQQVLQHHNMAKQVRCVRTHARKAYDTQPWVTYPNLADRHRVLHVLDQLRVGDEEHIRPVLHHLQQLNDAAQGAAAGVVCATHTLCMRSSTRRHAARSGTGVTYRKGP